MLTISSAIACNSFQKDSEKELFSQESNYLNKFTLTDQQKSPLDKREMKSVVFSNNLEALLISSKNYNKSSAAMDVAVGSLEDPESAPGMAHFLEHMLFLGTRKYPNVGEYSEYLSANQGMSNAYTSRENTNYYFEVNTDAFEGALDRFAQFFVDPLFLQDYVEREMNAVNSEHQKNLNSDLWRKARVLNLFLQKKHPQRKFSTGTIDTLRKIDQKDLVAFYKNQYSANKMKLVLMSPLPMDALEKLAKEKFSNIKNTNKAKNVYPEKLYNNEDLPRQISLKSIKDLRELELIFATPSNKPYWKSKPNHLITFLVGHEGEGSLLSLLKKRALATSLSAWFEETSYAGQFHFKIGLTEKGLSHKDEIITHFFSYIKLLKMNKLPTHLYEEIKNMSNIEFVYKEHIEGGSVASYYASRLKEHPALELESRTELFFEYNNDHYQQFLSYIAPSHLNAILIANDAETNQVEEYYKAEYSSKKIAEKLVSTWTTAPTEKDLFLPKENKYIPSNLALLRSDIPNPPRQLLDKENGILWFQEDKEFKQPKGKVSLLLETPITSSSPNNKVKTLLYQKALQESLNEWKYQVNLAGLDFSVSYHIRGLQLIFEGYSEHIPKLMKQLANQLRNLTISEENFEIIKNDFKRGLNNLQYDKAYQKVLYELNDLSVPKTIHYNNYYNKKNNLDLISDKTLDDIKLFSQELFNVFSFEGLAYGNLTENSIKNATLYYFEKFSAKRLKEKERSEDTTYKIKNGESLAFIIDSENNSPNHCWGRYVQFGPRDMILNASLRVANSILQPDFYHELRTQNQLGYIVHSGLRYSEKALGLLFLVQSSEYNPIAIENYFDKWEDSVLSKLERISDFELESLKNAVSVSLREKDKTIAERHATLYFEAITMKSIFQYKEKLAKITESLTKADIIKQFKNSFIQNRKKSITVYLDKNPLHSIKSLLNKETKVITDKKIYKKSMPTF